MHRLIDFCAEPQQGHFGHSVVGHSLNTTRSLTLFRIERLIGKNNNMDPCCLQFTSSLHKQMTRGFSIKQSPSPAHSDIRLLHCHERNAIISSWNWRKHLAREIHSSPLASSPKDYNSNTVSLCGLCYSFDTGRKNEKMMVILTHYTESVGSMCRHKTRTQQLLKVNLPRIQEGATGCTEWMIWWINK